jgi:hypothetical protein
MIVSEQLAREQQQEQALKQLRLSVAKDLFGPVLALEFQSQKHAAIESETRFDSIDSEDRQINFSINYGPALELSVAAADALLIRLGILRQ